MTMSRASQVQLESTPYYHCISRCVRRAFLCGYDRYTRKDFDHRKGWLVERMKLLARTFSIDICAYAVMSNHFHLVLRVDAERALSWTEEEVVERYAMLFKNAQAQLDLLEGEARTERLELYRARLYDLSWFMRSLNEHIARRANREDECTGRFWEGRFKSQPLLDEAALLTCMSYVDLNPVRSGASRGLEDSEFTSIQERLAAASARLDEAESDVAADATAHELAPFADEPGASDEVVTHELVPFADEPNVSDHETPLPMTLADYTELLDWTGRATRPGSRGRVRGAPPGLLARRGIDPAAWLRMMQGSGLRYLGTLGTSEHLAAEARRTGRRWLRGQGWARRLYDADVPCAAFCAAA